MTQFDQNIIMDRKVNTTPPGFRDEAPHCWDTSIRILEIRNNFSVCFEHPQRGLFHLNFIFTLFGRESICHVLFFPIVMYCGSVTDMIAKFYL